MSGARAAFSTRLGGVSEGDFESLNLGVLTDDARDSVLENRRRLDAALGQDPGATGGQGEDAAPPVPGVGPAPHQPGLDRPRDQPAGPRLVDPQGVGHPVHGDDPAGPGRPLDRVQHLERRPDTFGPGGRGPAPGGAPLQAPPRPAPAHRHHGLLDRGHRILKHTC